MTRHKEGPFLLSEEMLCQPHDIIIHPYTLPTVFDNSPEAEEAAARIISFSQQEKEWVGVSHLQLLGQMSVDEQANRRFFARRKKYKQAQRCSSTTTPCHTLIYYTLCVLTIGLFGLCAKRFKRRPRNPVRGEIPHSLIYADGISLVIQGINKLVRTGYLRQQVIRQGSKTHTVYFPTLKLIKRIMHKQGITAKKTSLPPRAS